MKTNTLNLENYGVQKMNAKEMKETEGGMVLSLFLGLITIKTGQHACY